MLYIRNGIFLVFFGSHDRMQGIDPPVIIVKTGMTSQEVRTTLGTPLITGTDPQISSHFHLTDECT